MKRIVALSFAGALLLGICISAFVFLKTEQKKPSVLELPPPYISFQTPNTVLGPGAVFVGTESDNAVAIDQVICNKLYLGEEPEQLESAISIPNFERSIEGSSDVSVGLISKALGLETSSTLKTKDFIKVNWGQTFEVSYAAEGAFLEDGMTRPISSACRQRIAQYRGIIKSRREEGGKGQDVYVLIYSLATNGFKAEYEYDGSAETQNSLETAVSGSKKLNGNIAFSLEGNNKAIMQYDGLIYLGYRSPWRVVEWTDTGQTSGFAIVKAEETNLEVLE